MKNTDKLNDLTGYYTLPWSGEPFEGEVIQLDKQSFNILFQNYSGGMDEWRFRQKLEKYDEWFADKPLKVYENWLKYIIDWMEKDK